MAEIRTLAEEREYLEKLIAEWNASRLDIFAISQPSEDLDYRGVMRFFFQDSGSKVATKCVRVTSKDNTDAVTKILVEKFHPDMKMLTNPSYSLYEVHPNGEAAKLKTMDYPLRIQLEWQLDDREGRFLLKSDQDKIVPTKNLFEGESNQNLKRRLSKREKKEMKKKRQEEAKKNSMNKSGKDDTAIAQHLYDELPETSFTRSISNPEAVMRRRRQQKLEKKLKEFETRESGPGGTLKIFAETLRPEIPYKTLLVSVDETTSNIVKEALVKYDMEKEDPEEYCLVMVNIPPEGANTSATLGKERVVHDEDCPLRIAVTWPENRGAVVFHLRRRANLPKYRRDKRRSKSPSRSPMDVSPDKSVAERLAQSSYPQHLLPYLQELSTDGRDLDYEPKIHRLQMNVTDVGSEKLFSSGGNHLQLFAPHILPRHCVITNMDGRVSVTPSNGDAEVFVDGKRVYETTTLQHGDAVKIGRLHTFRFCDPAYEEKNKRHSAPSGDNGSISSSSETEHGRGRQSRPRSSGPTMHSRYDNRIEDTVDVDTSGHAGMFETTFDIDGDIKTVGGPESADLPYTYDRLPPGTPPGSPGRISDKLPATLEFRENGEDAFFAAVISEVNGLAVHFKLAPTYTLYMCSRYRMSLAYRPDLVPQQKGERLGVTIMKIANMARSTIRENSHMPGSLAFWMANCSELLHFVKEDIDISPYTKDSQTVLAKSVQLAFRHLVLCVQHELRNSLPAFLDQTDEADMEDSDMESSMNDSDNDHMGDGRSFRVHDRYSQDGRPLPNGDNWMGRRRYGRATVSEVIYHLSSTMSLLRRCRVNAALTIQVFSQLFHFVNMWLFNKLVLEPKLGLCSRDWGRRLSKRLARIEAWALKQGLELAADCHLGRIQQAAHLLLSPKSTSADINAISSSCFKLNSLQMRTLLESYRPAHDEYIPQELIDRVVAIAEGTADQTAYGSGQEIQLEEDSELQLPFLLPEDGYSCEVIRGVPQGLKEFLEPLAATGLCKLTIQPASSGLWTVYQKKYKEMGVDVPMSSQGPEIVDIMFNKGRGGMGLSIVAAKGAGQDKLGIYIKQVVKDGPAAKDGRLQAGDQLIGVNGESLVGVTQEKAAECMVKSGSDVTLRIVKQGAIYHGLATLFGQQTPLGNRDQPRKLTPLEPDHDSVPTSPTLPDDNLQRPPMRWLPDARKQEEQPVRRESYRYEDEERRRRDDEERRRRDEETDFRLREDEKRRRREEEENRLREEEELRRREDENRMRLEEEGRIREEEERRRREDDDRRRREEDEEKRRYEARRRDEELRLERDRQQDTRETREEEERRARIEERKRREFEEDERLRKREEEIRRRMEEERRIIEEERRKLAEERRLLEEERNHEDERRRNEERKRFEETRLLEEERKLAEDEKRRVEENRRVEEKRRAEEERRRAEEQKKAEEERRMVEEQRREEAKRRAEEEERALEEKRRREEEEEMRIEEEEMRMEEERRYAEEQRRLEEERRVDDERYLMEQRRRQDQRLQEEQMRRDEERRLQTQRRIAEERQRAENSTPPSELPQRKRKIRFEDEVLEAQEPVQPARLESPLLAEPDFPQVSKSRVDEQFEEPSFVRGQLSEDQHSSIDAIFAELEKETAPQKPHNIERPADLQLDQQERAEEPTSPIRIDSRETPFGRAIVIKQGMIQQPLRSPVSPNSPSRRREFGYEPAPRNLKDTDQQERGRISLTQEEEFERWERRQRELAEQREQREDREYRERELRQREQREREEREQREREQREREQHDREQREQREREQREQREREQREQREREQREREQREREQREQREREKRENEEYERQRRELEDKQERERLERERVEREERAERERADENEREKIKREAADRVERERLEQDQAARARRERLEREYRERIEREVKDKEMQERYLREKEEHEKEVEKQREKLMEDEKARLQEEEDKRNQQEYEKNRLQKLSPNPRSRETLDYIEAMSPEEVELEFKRRLEKEKRRRAYENFVDERRAGGLVSVTRVTYHQEPDNKQESRDQRLQRVMQEAQRVDQEREELQRRRRLSEEADDKERQERHQQRMQMLENEREKALEAQRRLQAIHEQAQGDWLKTQKEKRDQLRLEQERQRQEKKNQEGEDVTRKRLELQQKKEGEESMRQSFQRQREEEERRIEDDQRKERAEKDRLMQKKLEEQAILKEKEAEARRQLQEEKRTRAARGSTGEPDHVLELKERALADYERRRKLIDQEVDRRRDENISIGLRHEREIEEARKRMVEQSQQHPRTVVSSIRINPGHKPKKQVSFSNVATEIHEPTSPTYVVGSPTGGYTARITPAASVRLVNTRPPDEPVRPPPPVDDMDDLPPPPPPPPDEELLNDDHLPPPPPQRFTFLSDRSSSSSSISSRVSLSSTSDTRSPMSPAGGRYGDVFSSTQSNGVPTSGYATFPRAGRPVSYPMPADLDDLQIPDSMKFGGSSDNVPISAPGLRHTQSLGRLGTSNDSSVEYNRGRLARVSLTDEEKEKSTKKVPPPVAKKPESLGFRDKMKMFNHENTPEAKIRASKWQRENLALNGDVTPP